MVNALDADAERFKDFLLAALRSGSPPAQALPDAVAQFSPACVEPKEDGSLGIRVPPAQKDAVTAGLRLCLLTLLGEASASGQPLMEYDGGSSGGNGSSSGGGGGGGGAAVSAAERAVDPAERGMALEGGGTPPAGLIPRFLDCALQLADTQSVDLVAQLGLLEDVVEVCSSADCGAAFEYLLSKQEMLRKPHFYKGKLTVLRMVNSLLRRLSAATTPELCGLILAFAARFLPISERSGVNLGGAYNTGNTTPVEDVPEGAVDGDGQPIDASFYRLFWGLQAAFSHPPSVLPPGHWAHVVSDIRSVLAEFRSHPVSTSGAALLDEAVAPNHNPKYLSSPQLLRLQLRDAELRQHFLVQCLILANFARQPPKRDPAKEPTHQLKPKQLEDLQALEDELYAALEGSGGGGSELASLVRTVLRREMHWVAWKNDGCKAPIERPPAERPKARPPAPKRQRMVVPPRLPGTVSLGTPALDELWNVTSNNGDCLGAEDREHLPCLEEFLQPVADGMDPDPEVQAQPKIKDDPVYCWKAYRLLARENLAAFEKTVVTVGEAKPNLERAVCTLYPQMVPKGATWPAGIKNAPPGSASSSQQQQAAGGGKGGGGGGSQAPQRKAQAAAPPAAAAPSDGAPPSSPTAQKSGDGLPAKAAAKQAKPADDAATTEGEA